MTASGEAGGPTAERPVAVEIRGLTKTYPGQDKPALADVSLAISDGDFFSLLGPSGSGKTTTLRLIAGLEAPDAGVVLLGGVDVSSTPPYRRNVNTVFQNYALFPHMNVLKNVQYPLRMKGVKRTEQTTRAGEALELVKMTGFNDRLPHELSGGQRQRVALARALVSRPKVLLLDEPLGALDLQLRQKMQVVLKDLQQQVGITFIYVTHDQGEALAMSSRIAVMNQGRIEQCSTARDMYFRPTTRFVAGFIGKSNLLECTTDGSPVVRWGPLAFRTTSPLPAGTAAFAVRNESIRVGAATGEIASENQFDAVVHQSVFLGDAVEMILAVGDAELTARVPMGPVERWSPGSTVRVAIAPEDLRVLHD